MKRMIALAAAAMIGAAMLAAAWPSGVLHANQDAPAPELAPEREPAQREQPRPGADFTMLVQGLKNTPGCLGVEVAQFQSGKLSIMAWFEDKAAALRWYNHPIHQGAQRMFFPDDARPADHVPMAHIEDESAPLMVVATLTPNRNPEPGEQPMQQISIELYHAAPGGLAVGGRLAPDAFTVPHLIEADRFGPAGDS